MGRPSPGRGDRAVHPVPARAAASTCAIEDVPRGVRRRRVAWPPPTSSCSASRCRRRRTRRCAGCATRSSAGTGLAGWHGGIADSYRASSDYLQLIGGQFATHPSKHPDEAHGDESDNFLDYTVELTDLGRAHEIMAGIDDFTLTHRAVLGAARRPHRRARDDDAPGPAVPPVAPPDHVAGGVDAASGARAASSSRRPGTASTCCSDPNVRTIIERGMLWASAHARVGIVGLGVISGSTSRRSRRHRVCASSAVADLDAARARPSAARIPGCRALTVDELARRPRTSSTVLNLTIPAAHAEVALAAIAARQGRLRREAAGGDLRGRARRDGCRGRRGRPRRRRARHRARHRACRRRARRSTTGRIGRPVSASAIWISPGHECVASAARLLLPRRRRPAPRHGAVLRHLARAAARPGRGGVGCVVALARRARDRLRARGRGRVIPVEVDTHVTGVLAARVRCALDRDHQLRRRRARPRRPSRCTASTGSLHRARPQHVRRRRARCTGSVTARGRPSSRRPATRTPAAASGCSTLVARRRGGRAARSRCTCSRS